MSHQYRVRESARTVRSLLAVGVPETAINLLLGAIAGGVIANIVISELPREKEGQFVPFLVGAVVYAALLILVA